MKWCDALVWLPLLGLVGGCGPNPQAAEATPPQPPQQRAAVWSGLVPGKTQPVPGGRAIIAPVPLHPVVEVRVKPGDRVKKGQVLVKLDDDEAQADVRTKQAALESATIALREARRSLASCENSSGALPEVKLYEARVGALKAEQDEKCARAALESSQAELEHFTVVAPLDGVVSRLDVNLGTVSLPGRAVWGEILDLSEIDVRCDLAPDQADAVAVGQTVAVSREGYADERWHGQVAFVGVAADPDTGRIPVLVRLPNAEGRFRAGVPVSVRFGQE
jgi:membrane fusion protein (multidrug efflux system)